MSNYTIISQLANRAQKLADSCNLHAEPGQPYNPWEVVGGLRQLTSELVRMLEQQDAMEAQDRFRLREQRRELWQMSEQRRRARERPEREFGVRARGEI